MIDIRTLMRPRQKCAGPQNGEPNRLSGTQHDVGGQICIFRPQPVRHPGAHARPGRQNRPVIHQQQCRAVIGIIGVGRTNDAHVVDAFRRQR